MACVGCYHSERGRGTSFASRKVAMSTMVPGRCEESKTGGEAGGAWYIAACRGLVLTHVMVKTAMHTPSPFDQLMAAIGTDKVVGTDVSNCPLSRESLKYFVAHPGLMKAYLCQTFRFRETHAPLDTATVHQLSDLAISRLVDVLPAPGMCRCRHVIMQRVSHRCAGANALRVNDHVALFPVNIVLANHANLVSEQFRAAYPSTESLPRFVNHQVTPRSSHVVPAAGKPYCTVGGDATGWDLVLDAWNHEPSAATQQLQRIMRSCGGEIHRTMCVGLSGSGKTTAAMALAQDSVVILVTASSCRDNDDTLPSHFSKDWRQLLKLAQARPEGISPTDNKLWLRMAWLCLVYSRLLLYKAFLAIAQGDPKQVRQQWLLVQREYRPTVTVPLASKLKPTTAVVSALERAILRVRPTCHRGRVVVVVDEAQRVNDGFPLKLPNMHVRY